MSSSAASASAVVSLLVLVAVEAHAGDPRVLLGGRLRLGGEVVGTIAPEDEGYFNYSDYETSTLRLFRVDLMAELRLFRFASVLFDARSDNLATPRVYALYLRVRPWQARELDVQAGVVPPVFGAFSRRRYAADNPLPSLPLAYQYLVTVRTDSMPSNAEQVVFWSGRGWQFFYPIGDITPGPGLPLASAERWDAGIQARVGIRPLSLAVSVTQGVLSRPSIEDVNGGKQVSARLAFTPAPAFVAGVSVASGEFLADSVRAELEETSDRDSWQRALGLDLEWSAGQLILRGEAVFSRFRLPPYQSACNCGPQTTVEKPLDALGLFVEGRYKLRPGLYVASRVEHLKLSELPNSAQESYVLDPPPWDAPVTRFELGAGFSPARHVLLKASWQHNWRDGGRVRENDLVAAQVLLWF